jgi:hypothetical protein
MGFEHFYEQLSRDGKFLISQKFCFWENRIKSQKTSSQNIFCNRNIIVILYGHMGNAKTLKIYMRGRKNTFLDSDLGITYCFCLGISLTNLWFSFHIYTMKTLNYMVHLFEKESQHVAQATLKLSIVQPSCPKG